MILKIPKRLKYKSPYISNKHINQFKIKKTFGSISHPPYFQSTFTSILFVTASPSNLFADISCLLQFKEQYCNLDQIILVCHFLFFIFIFV